MKHVIILIAVLSPAILLHAQTGAHTPTQPVRFVSVSSDGTRCLTISYDDVVLWDYQTKKPIWIKKAAELGGFYNLGFYDAVNVDHTLSFMIKQNNTNKPPFHTMINLNTLGMVGWLWAEHKFASDGRIPAREYGQGKNKNSLYMLNLHTGDKEFITDKLHDIKLDKNNTIIVIQKLNGKDVPEPSAYYSVKDKAFVPEKMVYPKTYYNQTLKRSVVPGEEDKKFHRFGFYERKNAGNTKFYTLGCSDESEKLIKEFPLLHGKEIHPQPVVSYSEEKKTVSLLELEKKPGNITLSFFTTYNFLTGEVIENLELTSTSQEALVAANASLEKSKTAAAEQDRINNLPENLLKQRINMLTFRGRYLISVNTHHIYKVRNDKGPYQNELVCLDAITGMGTFEVFENLTRLENQSLYKGIENYQTCPTCQGRSVVKTYTEKETDQTYSAGRKIVETTTLTNACTSCGGCGVIPK